MSLIHTLQYCVDTEHKEVYEFLQFLDTYANVSPENKSLEVQRNYAVCWCVLSQFLYENRHHNFMLPEQLKFTVHFTGSTQKCLTSVHWYQSFYQVDLLSKQLLQDITRRTGGLALGNKVKSLVDRLTRDEMKIFMQYLVHGLDTLALLNLCIHIIDTACTSFQDEPVVNDSFKPRIKWLIFVCVWLRGTIMSQITSADEIQLEEGFRMLQGCILLLIQDPVLIQDTFIGCIEKQLRTQMYLAGAKYYLEENKTDHAAFCYSKAVLQGWKADEKASRVMEEDSTVLLELDFEKPDKKPEDLITKPIYFTGICKELIESNYLRLRPCKQKL